ncbi:MAG TPA: SH3-like domain-containing protein [Actinomycetales bacterium]|nr:SH3-like domain-containing protein [Actinomycetales bacterium]
MAVRPSPLAVGVGVRVRTTGPSGHVRTPGYLRGASGTVVALLGRFPNPERLAYGAPAPLVALYRVEFAVTDVFGPADGASRDVVTADIYEHWLEEVQDRE